MALWGVLADVHANLEALEAVLAHAPDCERWICLGDAVGYGPNPNECCDRLHALRAVCISGNHEAAVLGRLPLSWFSDLAREAVVWTRRTLGAQQRSLLATWPTRAQLGPLTLVHGSLADPWREYIRDAQAAVALCDRMKTPVCLVGHTHVAECYTRVGGTTCRRTGFPRGGEIALELHTRYVVNCGAVGQPRDGNPEASYGVYDSEGRTIRIHRVPYPIAVTQARIEKAGLPFHLGQRLVEGW